jgi:hydroxymethylglutaryl-CoA lyase
MRLAFPLLSRSFRSLHSVPSNRVKIVEVGPRDGLQNESKALPTSLKVEFINRLSTTGLKFIEAASFVSPKWVPQMAGSADIMNQISRVDGITYSALTPNIQGFDNAVSCNTNEVAIFAAASDSFSLKNINVNVHESFQRFKSVIEGAKQRNIRVRGYVSCALGCPYEGPIHPEAVAFVAHTLLEMGVYEISLGDTIGVGTPYLTRRLLQTLKSANIPLNAIAMHFHNTYGSALANILQSIDEGVRCFDASVGGLGGCPYARGASGNVPTEDVVYMLEGMGFDTGVDLEKLAVIGDWISKELDRTNQSKAGSAYISSSCAKPDEIRHWPQRFQSSK